MAKLTIGRTGVAPGYPWRLGYGDQYLHCMTWDEAMCWADYAIREGWYAAQYGVYTVDREMQDSRLRRVG